jgi:hypothetical protein
VTDIFDTWKRNRFVVADRDLVEHGELLVVLTDLAYWSDHIGELISWCSERDANTLGCTVVFGSEAELTEFVLKWS